MCVCFYLFVCVLVSTPISNLFFFNSCFVNMWTRHGSNGTCTKTNPLHSRRYWKKLCLRFWKQSTCKPSSSFQVCTFHQNTKEKIKINLKLNFLVLVLTFLQFVTGVRTAVVYQTTKLFMEVNNYSILSY